MKYTDCGLNIPLTGTQDVSEFMEGYGLGAASDSEAEDEESNVSGVHTELISFEL